MRDIWRWLRLKYQYRDTAKSETQIVGSTCDKERTPKWGSINQTGVEVADFIEEQWGEYWFINIQTEARNAFIFERNAFMLIVQPSINYTSNSLALHEERLA